MARDCEQGVGQAGWLLDEVAAELDRARSKFPRFNSPHEGWAVIREELDELWEHVCANDGRGERAFAEAIQIAAMAVRYAHDLSRISELHTAYAPHGAEALEACAG